MSPDEKIQAVVLPVKIEEGNFNENNILIQSDKRERLAFKDHSSPDHEHVRGVLKAGWTPDSQFFVYSTASSGGHSAWHFNTFVYVRARNRFYELDDFVGSIVDPNFLLSPPDRFRSYKLDPNNADQGSETPRMPVDLQLSQIDWDKPSTR